MNVTADHKKEAGRIMTDSVNESSIKAEMISAVFSVVSMMLSVMFSMVLSVMFSMVVTVMLSMMFTIMFSVMLSVVFAGISLLTLYDHYDLFAGRSCLPCLDHHHISRRPLRFCFNLSLNSLILVITLKLFKSDKRKLKIFCHL